MMELVKYPFSHSAARHGKELLRALRENLVLVLFAVLLLFGVACGALSASGSGKQVLDGLDFLFNTGMKTSAAAQPIAAVFAASFASSFLFLFACFLCGLSMWGSFIIPGVVFFRGYGLGVTSGYLYLCYGAQGALFNLAVVLPGAFVCCLAVLLAAREGFHFSRGLGAAGAPLKSYFLHFGAILGVALTGAIIDLLTNMCFVGLFSF